MSETGITPQSITTPRASSFTPAHSGGPQESARPSQSVPIVDTLEISSEAQQRLSEYQADDDVSVTASRLSAESANDESDKRRENDLSRQRAIVGFRGGGLFEPPPELIDEQA